MLRRILGGVVCGGLLLGGCASSALAANPDNDMRHRRTVVSVHTFTPQTTRRNLLKEAASITVSTDTEWGGIETLDVPQTESPAEKQAREQAEQAEKARQEAIRLAQQQAAAAQAQQQAANRNADRQPLDIDGDGSQVIQVGSQYVGSPYVYGGTTPAGFDCSGFTQYVFAQLGVSLPHQSESQRAYAQAHGIQVNAADAQPGDLMWHYGHVGIYAGNGLILHAATPAEGVCVQSASYSTFEYYRLIQ